MVHSLRRNDRYIPALVAGLAVVASVVLFSSLGRPAMEPDESLYALATDQIRATGQWWTLSPQPPSPYFNKPPLYMWLSALTYDLLPGFEFRYRFWSAVFGVVAVVMTGVLAARLFRWEVGLIAGLLLLTNRSFLIDHGARFGGMDAGLTACLASILWLYWRGGDRGGGLGRWIVIGVVAGVATLLKPLGGVPMLAIVTLHALLLRRGGVGKTLTAAGVALLCAILVSAPWHLINHLRYPNEFASHLFGRQLADAVAGGDDAHAHRNWSYYLIAVTRSSAHFLLGIPAAIWLLWTGFRRAPHRSAAVLLSIAGLGWIVALSLAQKKFLHYAYPGFVPIAIAIAAALAALVEHVAARHGRRRRVEALVLSAFIIGLCGFAGWLAFNRLPKMSDPSPIGTLYRRWQPDLHAGRARLLFWNVPHRPGQLMPDGRPLRPHMMIYLSHLRPATATTTPEELLAALASDEPTLVILPPGEAHRALSHSSAARLVEERWFTVVGLNGDRVAVSGQ